MKAKLIWVKRRATYGENDFDRNPQLDEVHSERMPADTQVVLIQDRWSLPLSIGVIVPKFPWLPRLYGQLTSWGDLNGPQPVQSLGRIAPGSVVAIHIPSKTFEPVVRIEGKWHSLMQKHPTRLATVCGKNLSIIQDVDRRNYAIGGVNYDRFGKVTCPTCLETEWLPFEVWETTPQYQVRRWVAKDKARLRQQEAKYQKIPTRFNRITGPTPSVVLTLEAPPLEEEADEPEDRMPKVLSRIRTGLRHRRR